MWSSLCSVNVRCVVWPLWSALRSENVRCIVCPMWHFRCFGNVRRKVCSMWRFFCSGNASQAEESRKGNQGPVLDSGIALLSICSIGTALLSICSIGWLHSDTPGLGWKAFVRICACLTLITSMHYKNGTWSSSSYLSRFHSMHGLTHQHSSPIIAILVFNCPFNHRDPSFQSSWSLSPSISKHWWNSFRSSLSCFFHARTAKVFNLTPRVHFIQAFGQQHSILILLIVPGTFTEAFSSSFLYQALS